jgi:hypothetical protein
MKQYMLSINKFYYRHDNLNENAFINNITLSNNNPDMLENYKFIFIIVK